MCGYRVMPYYILALHRTLYGLEINRRAKMAKMAVTWELVGKIISSVYISHHASNALLILVVLIFHVFLVDFRIHPTK